MTLRLSGRSLIGEMCCRRCLAGYTNGCLASRKKVWLVRTLFLRVLAPRLKFYRGIHGSKKRVGKGSS